MSHIVNTGLEGRICSEFANSIIHLDLGDEVLIDMVNEEITRKRIPKDENFGNMLSNVYIHLGTYIDMESVIKHYLYNRNIAIVKHKDIEAVLKEKLDLDSWAIIYDNYLKKMKITPDDDDYINVCDVILQHHLERKI